MRSIVRRLATHHRRCVAGVLGTLCLSATPVLAQTAPDKVPRIARWHDEVADSLVARAILRRGLQLADSTLLSYRANAHGFLAFLAQLGEGFIIPPKVVQSEELALTVSWWQPGQSAQQLVGRRDTTLLPAQVAYYRDRYAVVLDNLPDRIRLGDGFDVADVPHPLGFGAATRYEYRRGQRLTIRIPGREIQVDEVEFRPRDQSQASAVGSVYLDRETGAVVRLSMTFTRAAILDKRIETLVLTLENGLVNGRYWLPRRQEVEVARSSTWLDIPARGIVRGHWEISGYEVNERTPVATLRLPRWSSLPADSLKAYRFEGQVVDVLPPDMQVAGDEDVVAARKLAETAVRAIALTRTQHSSVYGRGISDLARFTRTEGVAIGGGVSRRWGDAWQVALRSRYGFSDHQVKGRLIMGRLPALGGSPLFEAFVERDYRDVAVAERGGVTNSLGALLLGSDFTTQVEARAAGINWRLSALSRWSGRLAIERELPLAVRAKPLSGTFTQTLAAWDLKGVRAEMRGGGSWFESGNPLHRRSWSLTVSAGAFSGHDTAGLEVAPRVARVVGDVMFERPLPGERALVWRTTLAAVGGRDLPPQWLAFGGGPWSAPGYAWSSFAGQLVASERVEFRQPVRAPSIPLRKYGRAPGHITLAPFIQVTAVSGAARHVSAHVDGAWPSVGLGTLFFFDLLRVDMVRGLRQGEWRLALDIDRGFWSVM